MRSVLCGGLILLAAVAVAGTAAAPTQPSASPASPSSSPMSLIALKQLEAGLWQFDIVGKPPRLVCVTAGTDFVQLEHDQPNCLHFVIASDPKKATVHYSCQKAGWGRTTVRVETARLATIQTQGIAHNAPFDYSVAARRIGACNQQDSRLPH